MLLAKNEHRFGCEKICVVGGKYYITKIPNFTYPNIIETVAIEIYLIRIGGFRRHQDFSN